MINSLYGEGSQIPRHAGHHGTPGLREGRAWRRREGEGTRRSRVREETDEKREEEEESENRKEE